MDTNDFKNHGLIKGGEKDQSQDPRNKHKQAPCKVEERAKGEEFQQLTFFLS